MGCDWGEEIEGSLAMAVFLTAPQEVRLGRIDEREAIRFGNRVQAGGDMHEQQKRFREFAAGRTEEPYRKQMQRLACPVLELDATQPLEMIVEKICSFYKSLH